MINLNSTLCGVFLMLGSVCMAQQSMHAASGNATGPNGNISYSIGQAVFSNFNGARGSVNQGVQQPYEFFTVGVDNYPTITLKANIYPNPTLSDINILIDDLFSKSLGYEMFDIQGKRVQNGIISDLITNVPMQSLAPGTYTLGILDKNKAIKFFKIIKN